MKNAGNLISLDHSFLFGCRIDPKSITWVEHEKYQIKSPDLLPSYTNSKELSRILTCLFKILGSVRLLLHLVGNTSSLKKTSKFDGLLISW